MPANIEQEDKILAGLTVRQLLIIAVPGIAVWAAVGQLHTHLPLPVLVAVAVPVTGVAAALALVRRDGLSLDQFVMAAARFHRAPKHSATNAPEPHHVVVPSWVDVMTPPLPDPLDLPVEAISDDGVLDLAEYGSAIILSCSTVNFALRTESEQDALVSGFASFLNSLTAVPVQILIRAEPVRLDPLITTVDQAAPTLPHPALVQAARDHADYLAAVADSRDLLHRQILLVLREPDAYGLHGAATLRRRAEDASRALAAAGTQAAILDGPAVAAVLASAVTPTTRIPPPAGLSAPDTLITGPPQQRRASP